MVGERELIRLAERKREIARENEAARKRFSEACARVKEAGGHVDAGIERARRLSPWLLLLAPAVGYLAARKAPKAGELIRLARSGLGWLNTARRVIEWIGRR